ncbi:MAG: hypothetical protein JNM27_22530 [Leptospirales bacterium]|nr:hypothetical protein [Leptospirales bacterium]
MAEFLILVEDPGPANFIRNVYGRLPGAALMASGLALDVLPEARSVQAQTPEGLLTQIAPRILVVGTTENRQSFTLGCLTEARKRGIQTVAFVDARMNAERRFSGNTDQPLQHAPDWLLVPDDKTRESFIALGFPDQKIFVTGYPHFDSIRNIAQSQTPSSRQRLRKDLFPGAADRPVVMFIAEGSRRILAPEYKRRSGYQMFGRGQADGRTEIALEEFIDAFRQSSLPLYLVMRIHPKDFREDYSQYLGELDLVIQGGNAVESVLASDLVAGLTSMLLQESIVMGVPSLSILPNPQERSWASALDDISVPVISNRDNLLKYVKALGPHSFARNFVQGEHSVPATDRVVNALTEIARVG